MNQNFYIVLARICPFAERAWITAHEKQCDFEVKEVSLRQKEAFFTQTYHKAYGHNPKSDGMVPILVDGDKTFCESDLISWYIAEKFPTGTKLIPKDLGERLKMRMFINNYASKIITSFYSFKDWSLKSEDEKEKLCEKARSNFEEFEKALVLPYAMGEDFTLADIMIYPWFERWPVLEHYVKLSIDKKNEKILKWIENIQKRESVKKTRQSDEYYIEGYKSYFPE